MANLSVYLYVPNLIGYARVALALFAFTHAFTDWTKFVYAYSLSQILDAADGYAARALNQSSHFGAVFDMVTDRTSTNVLLMILALLYGQQYFLGFAALAILDYASHWVCMCASAGNGSHKTMSEDKPWILRVYYRSKVVLFLLCFAQEACLLGLYVWKAGTSASGVLPQMIVSMADGLVMASAPFAVLKQIINVVQLVDAANTIVASEGTKDKNKRK